MKRLTSLLRMNAVSSVIFDFDETITTLDVDWSAFLVEFSKAVDRIEGNCWQAQRDKGIHPIDIYAYVCRKHGKKARDMLHETWARWEREFFSGKQTPNAPLVRFIRRHHKALHFHLWTLNTRLMVSEMLGELGIGSCFRTIVTRDDVFLPKPDTEGFSLIFDPKRDNRDTFLYIGDSSRDEEAARKAGICFMNVRDL